MKKKVLVLGMLALVLVFGFVLAGCASSSPKVIKTADIPEGKRCQLYIGRGKSISLFDGNYAGSWTEGSVVDIPCGEHTIHFRAMIARSSSTITYTPTLEVTYNFDTPGRMYLITEGFDYKSREYVGVIEDYGLATWAIPKVDKNAIGENESLFVIKRSGVSFIMTIATFGIIDNSIKAQGISVLKVNGKPYISFPSGGTREFVLPNGEYELSVSGENEREIDPVKITAASSLVKWSFGSREKVEPTIKPLK
jgi:hypothetical protein